MCLPGKGVTVEPGTLPTPLPHPPAQGPEVPVGSSSLVVWGWGREQD